MTDNISDAEIMKYTSDFDACMLAQFADPEYAASYLRVALEEYRKDGDIASLLLAVDAAARGIEQCQNKEVA